MLERTKSCFTLIIAERLPQEASPGQALSLPELEPTREAEAPSPLKLQPASVDSDRQNAHAEAQGTKDPAQVGY